MPVLIAFLVNALRVMLFTQGGRLIVGALSFLGLQFATYSGVVQPALDQVAAMMQGAPAGDFGAAALAWMGVLNIDKAVSMIVSAVVTKRAISAARMFLTKK